MSGATTLGGTVRYLPPGIRQVYIVDTIANPALPTLAELNAGTDVTGEIVDGSVTGFSVTPSTVEAPDLGSKTTRKVAGRISLDDCSIAFYLTQDGTVDARTLLADGAQIFVCIFPEGNHAQTPALTVNVHPVTVQTTTIDEDTTKTAQCMVSFAPEGQPHKNIAIPTV